MKILVCIKSSYENGKINRFDTFALEEAIKIRERFKDNCVEEISVDVLTMGPIGSSKIIRRAFGIGANKGIHILTQDHALISAFNTASAFAKVVQNKKYGIILTGIMSEDIMAGQTGPMLSELLTIPCATGIVTIGLIKNNRTVSVERELESGYLGHIEIQMPCVLTVQAGINTPRYPSVSKMLAAQKKEIFTLSYESLLNEPLSARERVLSLKSPKKTRAGIFIKGTLDEKVEQLWSILTQKYLL